MTVPLSPRSRHPDLPRGHPPASGRKILGICSTACLLTGLYGCYLRLSLPYGFGDGYKHANVVQLLHLRLASIGGVLALAAACIMSMLLLVTRRRLSQRTSCPKSR